MAFECQISDALLTCLYPILSASLHTSVATDADLMNGVSNNSLLSSLIEARQTFDRPKISNTPVSTMPASFELAETKRVIRYSLHSPGGAWCSPS